MSFNHPKIMVVGAGGMGALFGAILREGCLDVTLYDPNVDHIRAIQFDGLQVEGFGGLRVFEVTATNDASSIDGADVLLFQCKSQATRDGAQAVRHLVERGPVCISFQNGLGNEEALAEELGGANVIGGLTAIAGNLLGPGRVRDFSRVPSYIGEMGGGVSKRCQEKDSCQRQYPPSYMGENSWQYLHEGHFGNHEIKLSQQSADTRT